MIESVKAVFGAELLNLDYEKVAEGICSAIREQALRRFKKKGLLSLSLAELTAAQLRGLATRALGKIVCWSAHA